MGRYVSTAPRVKKQQVFTVSGTFTPSPGLLAAGGVVEVRCVGGGGAGGMYAGGSSGMDITRLVTVAGPVTVTIGAGGPSNHQGGQTTFGTLLTALGGKPAGSIHYGGSSSGEGSQAGENPFMVNSTLMPGRGGGGHQSHGIPNTGGGGGGNHHPHAGQGGSGLCIVTWEE